MMLKKTREGIGVTSGVTGIQKDKYGNVWLSTMGQGVFCMKKNGTLKQYIMPDGGKNIANIQATRKGDVWAISNWCRYNLTRYNSKKDLCIYFSSMENKGDITLLV
jgi:streptogramin lyase